MGVVFHRLCHHVPDDRVKQTQKQRRKQDKHEGRARANLRARRRLQLDNLVKESRIWMYAMSLPTNIIVNDNNDIQQELDNLNGELMIALLGTKILNDKILRVTGRMARNTLVSGLDNTDHPQMRLYPRAPAAGQMRRLIDDTYVKADTLIEIYSNCTGFKQNHPNARTWREIRKAAGPYTFRGASLRERLKGWQWRQARNHLGLSYDPCWTDSMREFIEAQLKSSKITDSLHDMKTFWRSDLIIVVPDERQSRATAALLPGKNTMTLYPRFYSADNMRSLRHISLYDGKEIWSTLFCSVKTFVHEITHADGVLETKDYSFRYNPLELDYIETSRLIKYRRPDASGPHRPPNPASSQRIMAYSLEGCLELTRRDQRDNEVRAKNNADSWAIYCMLRMFILVYPELDFTEAVRIPDLFAPRIRCVKKWDRLLHHCTLFEPLRHREAGSIRDHPDYDPLKDYFARPNVHRPQTLDEILDHLKAFDIVFYGT